MVPNAEQKGVNGFPQAIVQEVLHASFFQQCYYNRNISSLRQENEILFLSYGTVFVLFFIHASEQVLYGVYWVPAMVKLS